MSKIPPPYNNQNEKKKFFSLEIIDTNEQFFNFMKTLPKLYHEKKGIWRGIPESRFKLYNSLQRENIITNQLKSTQDVIKRIEDSTDKLAKWNRGVVRKYFDKNHNIPNVPLYAALSILQHHGCETPFLDWTRNPNVALYFATHPQFKTIIKENIDNYFSIYFITTEHAYYNFTSKSGYIEVYSYDTENAYVKNRVNFVIEHGGDEYLQKEARENAITELIQKKINNNESTAHSIEQFPIQRIEDSLEEKITHFLNVNYNITAQEGLFILNAYPSMPLEEAIHHRLHSPIIKGNEKQIDEWEKRNIENFICYDIHKKFIPRIFDALKSERINITKETMEPDFKKLKNEITFDKITNKLREK